MANFTEFMYVYGLLSYYGEVAGLALRNFGDHELRWYPGNDIDIIIEALNFFVAAGVLSSYAVIPN